MKVTYFLLSVILSLIIAEAIVRACGYSPIAVNTETPKQQRYQFDPELGWIKRSGHYKDICDPKGQCSGNYTFIDGNIRSSGLATKPSDLKHKVYLIGDSFIEGDGLADEQTLSWKLQSKLPSSKIYNFGTSAYGTYQSLLQLEQAIAKFGPAKNVIYGFVDFHDYRNIAYPKWHYELMRANTQGQVSLPYCDLGYAKEVQCFPPLNYPRWPLRTRFGLVVISEAICNHIRGSSRKVNREEVTLQLIKKMQLLTEAQGGKFLVIILHDENRKHGEYLILFKARLISVIDCAKTKLTTDDILSANGHPSESYNNYWLNCIDQQFSK